MIVSPYPPLFTHHPELAQYVLRQVTLNNVVTLAPAARSVVIYHPQSRSYFASVTKNPVSYFKTLFTQLASFDKKLPAIIREMQMSSNHFEFFILHPAHRNEFERTAEGYGLTRRAIAIGSQVTTRSVVLAVHNSDKNLTRYIAVPENMPVEKVLSLATAQFLKWLLSNTSANRGFKMAAYSLFKTIIEYGDGKIFNSENSSVYLTTVWDQVAPTLHRATVRDKNLVALKNCVLNRRIHNNPDHTYLYIPVKSVGVKKQFNIIYAVNDECIMGVDGKLPWSCPEDLEYFKRVTYKSTIIMGRKTWDSLPVRPLPNRECIVISNTLRHAPDGAILARSFQEALGLATKSVIWLIGGAQLIAENQKQCHEMHVTTVSIPANEGVNYLIAPDIPTSRLVVRSNCLERPNAPSRAVVKVWIN